VHAPCSCFPAEVRRIRQMLELMCRSAPARKTSLPLTAAMLLSCARSYLGTATSRDLPAMLLAFFGAQPELSWFGCEIHQLG